MAECVTDSSRPHAARAVTSRDVSGVVSVTRRTIDTPQRSNPRSGRTVPRIGIQKAAEPPSANRRSDFTGNHQLGATVVPVLPGLLRNAPFPARVHHRENRRFDRLHQPPETVDLRVPGTGTHRDKRPAAISNRVRLGSERRFGRGDRQPQKQSRLPAPRTVRVRDRIRWNAGRPRVVTTARSGQTVPAILDATMVLPRAVTRGLSVLRQETK